MGRAALARRMRENIRQRTFASTAQRALMNLGTSYYLEVGVLANDTERSARSFLGNRLTAQHNLRLVRFIESEFEQIARAAEARQLHAVSLNQRAQMRVYSYWDTGPDSAPEVARLCFERLAAICEPDEVVILDSPTIPKHITPPEDPWFLRLNEQEKADLYRLMLLHRYGGCWSDATCFLRERPHQALDQLGDEVAFFAFSGQQPGEMQNFFLWAKPAHPALAVAIEAWLHVARHYDGLLPYFWFQITFKALYHLSDDVRNAWNLMPKIDWNTPHELPRLLYRGECSSNWADRHEDPSFTSSQIARNCPSKHGCS